MWQCQFNYSDKVKPAFFCVNTKTREKRKIKLLDPEMKGAQALSPEDYKRLERWAKDMKEWSGENCK